MQVVQHAGILPRQAGKPVHETAHEFTALRTVKRRQACHHPATVQHHLFCLQQNPGALRISLRRRFLRHGLALAAGIHRGGGTEHHAGAAEHMVQILRRHQIGLPVILRGTAMGSRAAEHNIRHHAGHGVAQHGFICRAAAQIRHGSRVNREHMRALFAARLCQHRAEEPGPDHPDSVTTETHTRCVQISSASSRSPGSVIFRLAPPCTSWVGTPSASTAETSSVTTRAFSFTY